MKTHNLKCIPMFFKDVESGIKTFELRKNDRGFKVGDYLNLREWDLLGYTGLEVLVKVEYILIGGVYGLDAEHVIMAITEVADD